MQILEADLHQVEWEFHENSSRVLFRTELIPKRKPPRLGGFPSGMMFHLCPDDTLRCGVSAVSIGVTFEDNQ